MAISIGTLGTIFQLLGRLTDAEHAFRDALAIHQSLAADFPTMPAYQLNQATCHAALSRTLRGSNPTQAIEHLRQAIDLYEKLSTRYPSVSSYRAGLSGTCLDAGLLLAEMGRTQEAREALGQAVSVQVLVDEQSTNKLDYWYGLAASNLELGRLLVEAGRGEEAEGHFRRACEISEKLESDFGGKREFWADLARTHAWIGWRFSRIGRPSETMATMQRAIQHTEKLVADFPEQMLHQQRLARCLNTLGFSLDRLGRTPEARVAYERALKAGGDTPGVWGHLAAAQLTLGDIDGYRASCAHLLNSFDQGEGWSDANSVAWPCVLSPGSGVDFARVVEVAELALSRRDPHAAPSYRHDVLNTIGVALYRAGHFSEAIERLGEAIDAHAKGGNPWDWFFLAMAHWKLGERDKAMQWHGTALAWMDQNQDRLQRNRVAANELHRFRAEAEELLAIDERTPP
jgi:tetratricopeptide (TPR) repeat protein